MSSSPDHLQSCFRCWSDRNEVFARLDTFLDAALDDRDEHEETSLIKANSTFTTQCFDKLKLLLHEAWEDRHFNRLVTVLQIFHFLADCQGDLRNGFDVFLRQGVVDVLRRVWNDVVCGFENEAASEGLQDVGCEVINTLTAVTDYSKEAKMLVVEKLLFRLLEAVLNRSIGNCFDFRTKILHFTVGLLERCEGESKMSSLLKTPGLLEQLANIAMRIPQLGDIEHQLSMTELLLMASGTRQRRKQLSCAFGDKKVQTKFMSISMDDLEEDTLRFLILLNSQQKETSLVKSFPCLEASVGDHELKCPYVDKTLGVIVHVNIGTRRIVVFAKPSELQLSQNLDNPSCGTIIIQFDDIQSVQSAECDDTNTIELVVNSRMDVCNFVAGQAIRLLFPESFCPVDVLQRHLREAQEERESVSASSIRIGDAETEASTRRTATFVHESVSSFPVHVPAPSSSETADVQLDGSDDDGLSEVPATPERQAVHTPSPRTSTPQPESVISLNSGKTPDCEAIEKENSPIETEDQRILVVDTQQPDSNSPVWDEERAISRRGNGLRVIPSSQPDIDMSDGPTQVSKKTPVIAVRGRRRGEPSPSPSTLVHIKSKAAGKKLKTKKIVVSQKAGKRENKSSKRKTAASKMIPKEVRLEEEKEETAASSRSLHLRPVRSSKIKATERLKEVTSQLSEESEECEQEEEEMENVSEYRPPNRKEKTRVKRRSSLDISKSAESSTGPPSNLLDEGIGSTSGKGQDKYADEQSRKVQNQEAGMTFVSSEMTTSSPITEEQGLSPALTLSEHINTQPSETAQDGSRDGSQGKLPSASLEILANVHFDGEQSDDQSSAGGDRDCEPAVGEAVSHVQETSMQAGAFEQEADSNEGKMYNPNKADRRHQKQQRKRRSNSSTSKSLLEFTRAIIRERYEQSQRQLPARSKESNNKELEEESSHKRRQRRGKGPNLKTSSKSLTNRVEQKESAWPLPTFGRKRSSSVGSRTAGVEEEVHSPKKKNRRTRRPTDTISPGIDLGHKWTPTVRTGRRMGVLNVTTTPVSIKSASNIAASDIEEEHEKKMTKELDMEETEDIGQVGSMWPDWNVNVVPDVGMEQEIEDNIGSSCLVSSHPGSQESQAPDHGMYYLITSTPSNLSTKQSSKDLTSGYASMYSPLESGPTTRKRPRKKSPATQFKSPAKSFDGRHDQSSDESESEEAEIGSEPVVRKLFQTTTDISGVGNLSSHSGMENANRSEHSVSADLSCIFDKFGHRIQQATNHKKKLMENFVHNVGDCTMKRVDDFVDARRTKRHQVLSRFFEETAEKLTACEKTVLRMKNTEKRLESVFAETMKALHGCLNEQKENFADVKQLQQQFGRRMTGLAQEDGQQQQLMKSELQQELGSLREAISREFQQQEMTSLRRSLQSMIMDM